MNNAVLLAGLAIAAVPTIVFAQCFQVNFAGSSLNHVGKE